LVTLNIKKEKMRLTLEIDERWRFVGKKQRTKKEVWLAMDREIREVVGLYVGGKRKC
jgi:insertion element IS1 protein InsB